MKYCENLGQLCSIIACIVSIPGFIQSYYEYQWFMFCIFIYTFGISFVTYIFITKHVIECNEYAKNHKREGTCQK